MCSPKDRQLIGQEVKFLCMRGEPFSAKQVVKNVRLRTNEYLTHTEIAVEVFKLFQDGKFRGTWVAQPVTTRANDTYVVYHRSLIGFFFPKWLLRQTYRR